MQNKTGKWWVIKICFLSGDWTEAFDHGLGSGSSTTAVLDICWEDRVELVTSPELFFARSLYMVIEALGVIDKHLLGREGCGGRKGRTCWPCIQASIVLPSEVVWFYKLLDSSRLLECGKEMKDVLNSQIPDAQQDPWPSVNKVTSLSQVSLEHPNESVVLYQVSFQVLKLCA